MKSNIRVRASFSQGRRGDGQDPVVFPLVLSFACHLVLLLLIVFTPQFNSEPTPSRSVINVSMVSLKTPAPPAPAKSAVEKKTVTSPKKAVVKSPTPPKKKAAKVVKKPLPKPKTSLKKKTFKTSEVVKRAMKELEKKVATETTTQAKAVDPDTLKSALDRLKKEVSEAETARSKRSTPEGAQPAAKPGTPSGQFNEKGRKRAELIDLYRLEIAYKIQKNWAFNEQLAGGDQSLVAAIVFKVMPDGEIRDIFFTDRSGNTYLDDSAYKAIMKTNPTDRHPSGLIQPYVVMAIRFTPQGIR